MSGGAPAPSFLAGLEDEILAAGILGNLEGAPGFLLYGIILGLEEDRQMEREMKTGANQRIRIWRLVKAAVCVSISLVILRTATAQTSGPLKAPPTPPATPAPKPVVTPPPTKTTVTTTSNVTLPPPTLPPEELIKKFAAREDVMKEARGNYTYTQKILVKAYDE